MIGGFQVGPFQLAYQQVVTAVNEVTGGWLAYNDFQRQIQRRRALLAEAERLRREAMEEARENAVHREIARKLHEQLRKEQEQEELDRLRRLVDKYDKLAGTSDSVQLAFMKAKSERTFSRLQALQRELIRAQEEEEMALLMILLADE